MANAKEKDSFALRIVKSVPSSSIKAGDMCIVISPNFSFLKQELEEAFEAQDDVKVTVDRRKGERRRSSQNVSPERRRANRRRPKAELLEVVIAT
jgi:hypothetical protein